MGFMVKRVTTVQQNRACTSRAISCHCHMLPHDTTNQKSHRSRHAKVSCFETFASFIPTTMASPQRGQKLHFKPQQLRSRSFAQLRILATARDARRPRVHVKPLDSRSPAFIQRPSTNLGRLPPVADQAFREYNPWTSSLRAIPKGECGVFGGRACP